MNIALLHFRVGETDGVSLEMEKWKQALEQAGHTVVFFSGTRTCGEYIPGLEYDNPVNEHIHGRAFEHLDDAQRLQRDIESYAGDIQNALANALKKHAIDVLVANNVLSLGHNLAAGMAVTLAAAEQGVRLMAHHHDFHWERERYQNPTCDYVIWVLENYFPSVTHISEHIVINSLAQRALRMRYGVESAVVPNVFDFQQPSWTIDSYNQDFRSQLGLTGNDLVLLQATRITKRKAIELAVQLAARVQEQSSRLSQGLYDGRSFGKEQRLVLFLPGLVEAEPGYLEYLQGTAEKLGVELLWANAWVGEQRGQSDGQKLYSLWDCYAIADLVTYPSILEGWGNQLLEAVFAKRPIVLYEYPVYKEDIAPYGFHVGSFGDSHEITEEGYVQVPEKQLQEAAEAAMVFLTDGDVRRQAVEHNFDVGRRYLSYEALAEMLEPLFAE